MHTHQLRISALVENKLLRGAAAAHNTTTPHLLVLGVHVHGFQHIQHLRGVPGSSYIMNQGTLRGSYCKESNKRYHVPQAMHRIPQCEPTSQTNAVHRKLSTSCALSSAIEQKTKMLVNSAR